MNSELVDKYDLISHLNMYWLRPESALWDAIAAYHLGKILRDKEDILEVGIGNGFFSFLMLGGEIKEEFDWFYSVDPRGFWDNKDIFDHESAVDVGRFIKAPPIARLAVAVDHKKNLLMQASKLDIADEVLVHDCNEPLPFDRKYETIYSNMLYWLHDPISVIEKLSKHLKKDGRLVIVFPNSDFYRYCESYSGNNKWLKLVNRGRSEHIMWHMDIDEFEEKISENNCLQVEKSLRYLSEMTLRVWDYGLRPFSVPLINMANKLSVEDRLSVKKEWVAASVKLAEPLLENEERVGEVDGGYNLVVLKNNV